MLNERLRTPWPRRWGAAIAACMLLLVALASSAALSFVDAEGEKLISNQEREAVDSELDRLVEVRREEGDDGLVRAVARLARTAAAQRLCALRAADGRLLAGNLSQWPEGLGLSEDWRRVETLPGHPDAHMTTRAFEDGVALLVGRDDLPLDEFRARVLDAAWIAIAIVTVTCLGLAAITVTYLMQRVQRLSHAAASVTAGDFSARAPGADDGGPFGEIARSQNAMLDRIANLITGLRTVTDSLAHDLRTPLARTRRIIEQGILSESGADKEAALEQAAAQIDRTIAAFNGLIDIARADGGVSRDAMTDLDIDALADDVMDLFEPLAEERGVRIEGEFDPVRMRGHKPLLMQAASNILHNAIKHSPEGGEISFRLVRTDEGAEMIIADQGPGIPADKRDDAIKRFVRLEGAGPEEDGAGLGLAIADACARLHGGGLVLEDANPGLRVRLVLKRA